MKQNEKKYPPRSVIEQRYTSARQNLFLMILLTAVNLIAMALGADWMMLFSASVPYFTLMFSLPSFGLIPLPIGAVITVLAVGLYLLTWIMSKKHYGWMIAALVMFSLDMLLMLGMNLFFYLAMGETLSVLQILIQIWVLYYLIIGVRYGYLRTVVPEETEEEQTCGEPDVSDEQAVSTSTVPRPADMDVKAGVLLEAEVAGYRVCYRRVKQTNELVINGYVYDEVTMRIETAHLLRATVGSRLIEAGYDGRANVFIRLDGAEVAKKIRII